MPNTYVALRTETVTGSPATSVTFSLSGISGYTDLVIVSNGTSSGDASFQVQFNGDTTSGLYSTTYLYGTGSSAISGRSTSANFIVGMGRTNTTGGVSILQLQNYANTNTFKTILGKGGGAASLVITSIGLWRNTNAITSITLTPEGSNTISIGSTFSLYGIANADQGAAKATGGIITEDSQYWYHTFGASGAFVPKQSLTCDILQIAGGGGGGGAQFEGGGGGAGGLLAFTSQTVSTSQNITVGAGGPGGANASRGTNGNNSQFASLTASVGGGAGGNRNSVNGGSGGSGGGGSFNGGTGGTNTSGQGFAGGNGATSQGEAGGGGGAGGAGANSSNNGTGGGVGGVGLATYSSWGIATGIGDNVSGTVYFAGGGGGGSNGEATKPGGLGGGGLGNLAGPGGNAIAFTGGGGGGAGGGTSNVGGNGASGVVIIRYSK
jgi:hypothetical protein